MTSEEAILQNPPASEYNQIVLASILTEWNNPDCDRIIRKNAKELKNIVETLEIEGVSVFFYELPLDPALAQSRHMKTSRSALAEVFGYDNDRWLSLKYPADEIRWANGVHLDERSAIR